MRTRRLVILALLVILAAGGATAGSSDAVQFPPIRLFDLGGEPTQLPDILGRATVINFWATWCEPCRMELPELQRLYNEMAGQGLAVLAVDVDTPMLREETLGQQLEGLRPRIDSFTRGMNISLPVYLVDGRTQAELGINTIPMTVLLDAKGQVLRAYSGFSQEGMRDLRKEVATALARKGGKGGK
ncbi:MAG: TlpA disulfide reductase family protein [Acidobacteriota bacterium]